MKAEARSPKSKVQTNALGQFGVLEAIAEVGNSRERAQKAQEKAGSPHVLGLLSLFAASPAICSRPSDFFRASAFGFRPST